MAITLFHQIITKFVRNAVCILACVLIQPWYLAASAASAGTTDGALTSDAAQTADILGIRQEVEQIISMRRSGAGLSGERHQFNSLRAHVLRKIFEADLQNQSAESRLEFEIAYAYDAIAREQRKESNIKQTLNAVNFTQFGVFSLVTSSEGLHNQFGYQSTQSLISGGIGTVLGGASMLYGKVAKASHLKPPEFMWQYVNGKPVDGSELPPLVVRYLDSREPGESRTRREILNAAWKQQYKADLADRKTLAGIDDGKNRSSGYLYNRLSLLSFLYNTIAGFNSDLLSLLNQVRGTATVDSLSNTKVDYSTATTSGADDAARLLHLEPLLAELNSLKPGEEPERERELHITLLETMVSGGLDMAVAGDRCQKEFNYQSDVVLAQLNGKQGAFMQKLYEANFIQGGGFGSTAGGLFLTHHVKPAAVTLRVSGGIGLILTGLTFYGMRGFSRKTDTGPNSLADFFNLRQDKGFSPLVMNYLNSPSPKRNDGKSRRQWLIDLWTNNSVATVNLKDQRSLECLGNMPSCKKDRVKLVLNRISLLSSLRQEFNEFDLELLELLRKAWPVTIAPSSSDVNSKLSPSANATAVLLGVQGLIPNNEQPDENAKLLITRQVLEGFLAMISDADLVGHEIEVELKAADRLERQRDRIVQLTNSLNFLQGGIIGEVAGGLGFRNNRRDSMYTSNIFIISSAISTALAAISMLEQHGGWRRGEAKPNALGAAFGKKSEHVMLSPVGAKYLNSVAPGSRTNLTRREVLTKYWKESKVLSIDVKRDSAVEKLSAEGKAHHWWSETIKMINNRITMLFDLRAVLRSSNVGFYELLKAVD